MSRDVKEEFGKYCANCSSSFRMCPTDRKNNMTWTSIREIPVEHHGKGRNGHKKSSSSSIKVKSVLSSLYNLNYFTDLPLLLNDDDERKKDNDDDNFALCIRCANVLTNLYQYYNEFNLLRQCDSVLEASISKMDKILKQLQVTWLEMTMDVGGESLVENNCDPIAPDPPPQEQNMTVEENNCKPITPDPPPKDENMTVEQNNKPITLDPPPQDENMTVKESITEMPCKQLNPLNSPHSSSSASKSPESDVIQKETKLTVPTTTTSTPQTSWVKPGPWVKLCRLSKEEIVAVCGSRYKNLCMDSKNDPVNLLSANVVQSEKEPHEQLLCPTPHNSMTILSDLPHLQDDDKLLDEMSDTVDNAKIILGTTTPSSSTNGIINKVQQIPMQIDQQIKSSGGGKSTRKSPHKQQQNYNKNTKKKRSPKATTNKYKCSLVYTCSLCSKDEQKSFKSGQSFCQHVLSEHVNLQNYKTCPFSTCTYHYSDSFTDLFQLTTHLSTIHDPALNF